MSRSRLLAGIAGLCAAAGMLIAPPAAAGATDLNQAVRAAMLAAHDHYGTATLAQPLVEPIRRDSAEWAFGSTTIPAPAMAHAAPRTALFVAKQDTSGWRVELAGTAGFVRLARQAPQRIVSAGEKQLFASNFAAAHAAPAAGTLADTGLGLPWPKGVAWWMGGGPHGNSGNSRPFSSVDFNGGDGRVLAAGPGRVYKSCVSGRSALVTVVHPNGYSTSYYHMFDLTGLSNGSAVQTGTYLGHIGNELPCGGSSTGAHVHFSLLRGDTQISVNNMTVGGWTFFEGAQPYTGYAQRNGVVVRPGGQLTNQGAGEPGLPTGTVNGGSNSQVNLRSGPGLSYAVVDTVANGTTVRISCTARGDFVDGVWGRTDLWNELDTGSWISDGFVDTGSADPVAPACAS